MHRTHESADDRGNRFAIGLQDPQADRRTQRIFMAARVAAAVQIQADSRRLLLEGQPRFGLPQHDQRHNPVNSRAAPAFRARNRIVKGLWGRSGAQLNSSNSLAGKPTTVTSHRERKLLSKEIWVMQAGS